MIVPAGLESILTINPRVMHGDLCFKGTRVPLTVLLDNLEEGMSIDEFVKEYPSITRESAMSIIAWQQRETRAAAGLEIAS